VHDLTREARRELRGGNWARIASGRAGWPYAAPVDSLPLPPTMPCGLPWPRISIVTPSFNQGKYIEETILSVRNQGYPNVEHIIMDGGSTDETRQILERYRDGFAHLVCEKDEGQSDAINKGFKLATGEIFTWLNSDDMLAPGALAAVAMGFHTTGAEMIAGEAHIYRDGELAAKHLTTCAPGPLPLHDLLEIESRWLEGQFFYQPEVMFTREIWEKAGGHVRTDLYHSMDYELWVRMAGAGARLGVIGRPVAHFRFHPEQKTAGNVVGGFRTELPKARDAAVARLGIDWKPRNEPKPTRHKLRVVMFNDLGYGYGAGIAHRRMADALQTAGHDVFTVAAATSEHHHLAPKATSADIVARISSYKPDLVVVGNLHGAEVDPAVLGQIAAGFPTAFVMHDLWLLTGRCAYTGDCTQYLKGCGDECTCDKTHPKLEPEQVRPMWETKRQVLSSSPNFYVWANSDWARKKVNEVLDTMGLETYRARPQAITFGLDLDVFRPRDKASCREALGLPQDKFIIMSSSSSLADPRKGLSHLAAALEMLQLPDTLLTCVGWFDQAEKPPIPNMRAMGYMEDRNRLAMLYSAADLFVGPSLEEAFGQVFIEAAACGTPSVGYPVGGKPEAIQNGVSGLLTEEVSPCCTCAVHPRALRERRVAFQHVALGTHLGRGPLVNDRLSAAALLCDAPAGPRPSLRADSTPEHPCVAPARPQGGFRRADDARLAAGVRDSATGKARIRSGNCRGVAGRWAPLRRLMCRQERSGPSRLLIACRSHAVGQRLRLVQGGKIVAERDLPADIGPPTDRVLAFDVNLTTGSNPFEMHFWKWNQTERPLALLVTSITTVPAGAVPGDNGHAGRVIEPKPAASVTK
jgi:glycosyltransferase involved in cell wall biosynthesis